MDLKGKNVLLIGLAKTGISTIKLLDKLEANITVNDIKTEEKLVDILEELKDIKIQTTGKDLQNFGINPSPEYQKCFDYILEEKLKNPALTKEQEIELVKKYFKI